MVRTLVEIQGDRVSISVDGATSSPLTIDRVQEAVLREEVSRLERQVAELRELLTQRDDALDQAALDLGESRDKARKSREATGLAVNDRNRMARRVSELESSLAKSMGRETELEAQVERYKDSAYRENERAAQNKGWAERAEANGVRLSQALLEVEKSVATKSEALKKANEENQRLAAIIGLISGAVHRPEIVSALRNEWSNWTQAEAATLTGAVAEARRQVARA